eukprot:scaffold4347_cov269-Ochromonas_danica.AAC.19
MSESDNTTTTTAAVPSIVPSSQPEVVSSPAEELKNACHALLKDWQASFEDALLSVSKDSKFLKGYFRLASAQAELKKFDDAETTLKAALAIEPNNEIALKQLKSIRTKKEAAAAAAKGKGVKKAAKQLDESQMKEFMELQEQLQSYQRDLRAVKLRMASLQRENRVNSVTMQHIETLDRQIPLYRSVGKAFFAASRGEVEKRLEDEVGEITKAQRDLTDRQEYLERRIASHTANIQDLIK